MFRFYETCYQILFSVVGHSGWIRSERKRWPLIFHRFLLLHDNHGLLSDERYPNDCTIELCHFMLPFISLEDLVGTNCVTKIQPTWNRPLSKYFATFRRIND